MAEPCECAPDRRLDAPVDEPCPTWNLRGPAVAPGPEALGMEAGQLTTAPVGNPAGEKRAWPVIPGYEIQQVLGQGGMGIVYKARQERLNRVVALKMLTGGQYATTAEVLRFLQEAEVVARLQHPHIVAIHDVGRHDGQPFFTMEHIAGGSLARRLAGKPQPASWTASLLETLARAMHHAHERGVVHRDLKPANVLMQEDTPRVVDFGLAKRLEGGASLTSTGTIMGTACYMAPEQASGVARHIGPAADVYALGVILYECLTGRPPFVGATDLETVLQVLADEPPPPSRLQPATPRDLEVICLKCLEKSPKQRYPSARALADDLRRFQDGEPIAARPVPAWERSARWLKRRPSLVLSALLVLTAAVGILAGVWYRLQAEEHRQQVEAVQRQTEARDRAAEDAKRVKVEHHANFVYRRGAPEGVGPLSLEQVRRRRISYRLHRRGGRVEKMEVVNARGELTTAHDLTALLDRNPVTKRECRYEYRRNEQGDVVEETALDRRGAVVWSFLYTTRNTGYFKDARGYARARTGSGAAYIEFVLSPEGFRTQIHYFDREGKPQPNSDLIFSHRLRLDERGLVTLATNLGLDGRPALLKDGFATLQRTFDALGNITDTVLLDPHGRPALYTDGFARMIARYDECGNCTENRFLGIDGKPALHRNGFARLTAQYDAHGNRTETVYYGLDDKPARQGKGYARVRMRYDERGRKTEEAYFDADGAPALHRDGYHKLTARYDERGNRTWEAFWGLDGKPARISDGCAACTIRYDERDNKIAEAYFGPDGKPALYRGGYAGWIARYDDRGNVTEQTCFGLDGKPASSADGYARCTVSYDDRGNVTEMAYFDARGKPALHRDGNHRFTARCDERGNRIEEAYFGIDNKPVVLTSGFARWSARYNERGNKIEEAYFDADGKAALHKDGYARWTATFDERGNCTGETYFGTAGQPVLCRNGYAKWTGEYDARGNRIRTAYLGVDGRPILDNYGDARSEAAMTP